MFDKERSFEVLLGSLRSKRLPMRFDDTVSELRLARRRGGRRRSGQRLMADLVGEGDDVLFLPISVDASLGRRGWAFCSEPMPHLKVGPRLMEMLIGGYFDFEWSDMSFVSFADERRLLGGDDLVIVDIPAPPQTPTACSTSCMKTVFRLPRGY